MRGSNGQIIVSNSKYDSVLIEGTSPGYSRVMRLKVRDYRPVRSDPYIILLFVYSNFVRSLLQVDSCATFTGREMMLRNSLSNRD